MASSDSGVESAAEVDLTELKVRDLILTIHWFILFSHFDRRHLLEFSRAYSLLISDWWLIADDDDDQLLTNTWSRNRYVRNKFVKFQATDSPLSRGAESPRQRGDMVVCGECHTQFNLSSFTSFIEHKVIQFERKRTSERSIILNLGLKLWRQVNAIRWARLKSTQFRRAIESTTHFQSSTDGNFDISDRVYSNFHFQTRCVRSTSANPLLLNYNMDVTTDTHDLGLELRQSIFHYFVDEFVCDVHWNAFSTIADFCSYFRIIVNLSVLSILPPLFCVDVTRW